MNSFSFTYYPLCTIARYLMVIMFFPISNWAFVHVLSNTFVNTNHYIRYTFIMFCRHNSFSTDSFFRLRIKTNWNVMNRFDNVPPNALLRGSAVLTESPCLFGFFFSFMASMFYPPTIANKNPSLAEKKDDVWQRLNAEYPSHGWRLDGITILANGILQNSFNFIGKEYTTFYEIKNLWIRKFYDTVLWMSLDL